jgi:hypothetical protein
VVGVNLREGEVLTQMSMDRGNGRMRSETDRTDGAYEKEIHAKTILSTSLPKYATTLCGAQCSIASTQMLAFLDVQLALALWTRAAGWRCGRSRFRNHWQERHDPTGNDGA